MQRGIGCSSSIKRNEEVAEVKICSKCEKQKELKEFPNDPKGSGGKRSWCKSCYAEYSREWRRNNSERKKQANKKYREKNKRKILEYNRDYQKRDPIRNAANCKAQRMFPNSKPCAVEGCEYVGEHRHHIDYRYPDKVIWLCAGCHSLLHSEEQVG
jgi:hypothetical protein